MTVPLCTKGGPYRYSLKSLVWRNSRDLQRADLNPIEHVWNVHFEPDLLVRHNAMVSEWEVQQGHTAVMVRCQHIFGHIVYVCLIHSLQLA